MLELFLDSEEAGLHTIAGIVDIAPVGIVEFVLVAGLDVSLFPDVVTVFHPAKYITPFLITTYKDNIITFCNSVLIIC